MKGIYPILLLFFWLSCQCLAQNCQLKTLSPSPHNERVGAFDSFSYGMLFPFRIFKTWHAEVKARGFVLGTLRTPVTYFYRDKNLILFQLLLNLVDQRNVLEDDTFLDLTQDFDEGACEGPLVIIDGAPNDFLLKGAAKRLKQRTYRTTKCHQVILISADGVKDLEKKLALLVNQHGQIAKMEFVGHGLPGGLLINHDLVEAEDVSLLGWKGLFKPNAKIRIHSCETGAGEVGEKWTQALADEALAGGGVLYTSRRFDLQGNLFPRVDALPLVERIGRGYVRQASLSLLTPLTLAVHVPHWWGGHPPESLLSGNRIRETHARIR